MLFAVAFAFKWTQCQNTEKEITNKDFKNDPYIIQMNVIIGSHFVPLEGKFLLIALIIVNILKQISFPHVFFFYFIKNLWMNVPFSEMLIRNLHLVCFISIYFKILLCIITITKTYHYNVRFNTHNCREMDPLINKHLPTNWERQWNTVI